MGIPQERKAQGGREGGREREDEERFEIFLNDEKRRETKNVRQGRSRETVHLAAKHTYDALVVASNVRPALQ